MTDNPQDRLGKNVEELERIARIGVVRARLEDALRELDELGLPLAAAQLALAIDRLPSGPGNPIH